MQLELGTDAGHGIVQAVRTAIARAGIELARCPSPVGTAWWSAGLADAVDRRLPVVEPPPPYDAAPSPRSTRGATRA